MFALPALSSVSSMTSRLFTPSRRFFTGSFVEMSTQTPTTVTENSRIMSTMPRAVPPARMKSSTISARWPSRTARRERLIVSTRLPEPER